MENNERDIPTVEQFYKELESLRHKKRKNSIIKNTVNSLIVVGAVAIIISYMFLPVMKFTGTSMVPTLMNGDIVLCAKASKIKNGDIVAFYYNNKVLLKRVIGKPGDKVSMDDEGVVSVNDKTLDEPYVKELSRGICEIDFPYQIPENRLFVMGDNRGVSIDSRSVTIGCISEEYVIGKMIARIYPIGPFGEK